MALHPHRNWLPLVGHTVQVRIDGQTVLTGEVDAVASDNSMLWLSPGIPFPRMMVQRRQGLELWINHDWENDHRPAAKAPMQH
jgi:hypothetical protein